MCLFEKTDDTSKRQRGQETKITREEGREEHGRERESLEFTPAMSGPDGVPIQFTHIVKVAGVHFPSLQPEMPSRCLQL